MHTPIAVYGASGHTGGFVVRELLRRGLNAVAVGRASSRLPRQVAGRIADIDDPKALDRAFAGCAVIVNCAGPFLDTARPIIEAALRSRCSYIDITAEQASAEATFARYDEPARRAGVTVIPAAGFFGGLADLLASAAAGGQPADEIITAIALDHWWPTRGTRRTGERNRAPRLFVEDGQLVPLALPGRRIEWQFDAPHGVQTLTELPLAEIITINRHLAARKVRTYLAATALDEVRNAATAYPTAIDDEGRSAQKFAMEVVSTRKGSVRRATARGRDIYAVSAPIVVEAVSRMLSPAFRCRGALAIGQAFDALEFLRALSPTHFAFDVARRRQSDTS
jgi:NAD(P)-dependent dehydrogenase (short-subunit alcohol dehydrogenase family)